MNRLCDRRTIKEKYEETYPTAVDSGIDCKVCKERVGWVTHLYAGKEIGVCACPWTSWFRDCSGVVYRSEPPK